MRQLLFVCLAALSPLCATVVPDQSTLKLRTPALADVEQLKLRLNNGLEALLISDPGAPEAGAALSVETGTWQDPEEIPGQAHFTEHLLFLGNATYPEENGFRRFLDSHGGSSNAYTAPQITNFMFEVQADALPDALKRFSAMFVRPNFDPAAMGREQHAVDQEFSRAIANDFWRKELVMRHLNNSHHPDSGFGMGNLQTLTPLSSEAARAWFESHYSANLMHLVVYAPQPLSELQKMVEENFSAIPDRQLAPFTVPGHRRSSTTQGKLVAIAPHAEMRELTLTWELPYDYTADSEAHASSLVAFVLGHEGQGSLLSQLKEEGLAEGIRAGANPLRRDDTATMLFQVSISLTPKGVSERETVVERTFEAITLLQQEGVPPYIHDETNAMNQLGFEFQTRSSPFELVSSNAQALVEEPLATYPEKTILATRFDPQAAATIAEQLTPRGLHLTLVAPPSDSGINPKKREPYMGVEYAIVPIEEETITLWESAQPTSTLALPTPNPLIPTAVGVSYQGRPHPEMGTPLLLQDNDFGKAYYLQDKNFLTPQIAWRFLIKSQSFRPGNARSAALLDLWVRTVSESLNETAYNASLGGLGFGLEAKPEGAMLTLVGYSEKAPLFLQQLADAMRHVRPTQEEFVRYKESLASDYRNAARETPVKQAIALTKNVLLKHDVPDAERLAALNDLSYGALLLFADSLFESTYIETALFGNLTRPAAEALLQELHAGLQEQPYPAGRTLHPEVASLPQDRGPYLVSKRIRMEGNAAILLIEQTPYTLQRQAAQSVLAAGMEEPFFTALRTQQQTGYVVWSWNQEIERHLFSFFAVQSTTVDGRDLIARYEQMIDRFQRELEESAFPQARFEKVKEALIAKLEMPPKNPAAMSERLFDLAFQYDGDFDWRQQQIEALQALTYPEFTALSREFLGRANKARLAVLVEGTMPPETGLRYRQARTADKLRHLSTYSSREPSLG